MRIDRILHIVLFAILLVGCSDNGAVSDGPTPESGNGGLHILLPGFNSDEIVSRGGGHSNDYCWTDAGWNEGKVENVDFYLLKNGIVTLYQSIPDVSGMQCETEIELLKFSLDREKESDIINGLSVESLANADRIVVVANVSPKVTNPVGREFSTLYDDLTGLNYNGKQQKFVMIGQYDLPEELGKLLYNNVVVPLNRVAVKIRVNLVDASGSKITDFSSELYNYADRARIVPENKLPDFTTIAGTDNKQADGTNLYSAMVELRNPPAEGIYPVDVTGAGIDRNGSHVYYSYPTDWVDYSLIQNPMACPNFKENGSGSKYGHAGHNDGSRYTVADYDDRAPILEEREMFLIVKAQFEGTWYYYKVPVNYRLAPINDQQCFSATDLTDRIFPLYRAERNHFYDITVAIDRAGVAIPSGL